MTPKIGLIIIGDEILSGKREDKHMAHLIELLQSRGLALDYAHYVGDSPERITATLKTAFLSGDLVFSTGGIGATPDDHTRQCAAKALGVDLVLHSEAEALIRQRMQEHAAEHGVLYQADAPDNVHRLNMGMFPRGATIIPNSFNRIPGFSCGQVHFVPGFPVMAWPMMAWVLDTIYAHLHRVVHSIEKSVIIFGAMEAALTPLMERLEREFHGIKVFSLPSVDHAEFGRHIELGVKGEPDLVDAAYVTLHEGLKTFGVRLGPELVR